MWFCIIDISFLKDSFHVSGLWERWGFFFVVYFLVSFFGGFICIFPGTIILYCHLHIILIRSFTISRVLIATLMCLFLRFFFFISIFFFLNRTIFSIRPTRKTTHWSHTQKYCDLPIELELGFIKWIRKWVDYNCFLKSLAWIYFFFLRVNFCQIHSYKWHCWINENVFLKPPEVTKLSY